MATSYTSNKKIGALDSASTPLAATNEIVINQNGDILKTPLSAVEAKVFDAKTQTTTPTGTEVTIVRQTDGSLRQVPLANIVPALNITNAQISNSAAIDDTKLATINTAGKVTNNAVQAVSTNTANRIVTRDGSGNFAAGTITATLSGNATGNAGTATALQTGRTIALTGDVTGTTGSFNGSANVSAATTIANNAVTTAKIADGAVTSAKIADGTIATADLADGAVTSAKIADGTIVNGDIANTTITDAKLATISTAGKVNNSATTATSANTASAIVARDASGNFSAGTITASLTGNSSTATTLATGRTIALTGDVTGTTGAFNGSANVSAATTIANNAVTTVKIADANVTTVKIADANVTTAKIADANVTTAKVANDAIDNTKIRNSAALSVIGRSANSTGDPADIAAGTDGHVLRRSGTALGFGQVATAGITDSAVTTAKLATTTQQSLVPAGAVMAFAMNSAPSGWLAADGAAVSRSTYAALFAAIGTTHGAGNGSTTFNLPDLRGIFVRGSGSQTISGTAYSGTFAGKEQDAFKAHNHAVTDPGHIHNILYYQSTGGGQAAASAQAVNSATGSTSSSTTGISIQNTGGTETRPANIALLYCIKF